MIPWLIIGILCTMTQQYEKVLFYQKAISSSEEAVHSLSITDHREWTALAALALCWTHPRFQKPLRRGLAHPTRLSLFTALPLLLWSKESVNLERATHFLKTGN